MRNLKTEADYNDGDAITFIGIKSDRKRRGVVDLDYGDERKGFIRISEMYSESSPRGNTIYVPVACIVN